jgi:hypothetical protein
VNLPNFKNLIFIHAREREPIQFFFSQVGQEIEGTPCPTPHFYQLLCVIAKSSLDERWHCYHVHIYEVKLENSGYLQTPKAVWSMDLQNFGFFLQNWRKCHPPHVVVAWCDWVQLPIQKCKAPNFGCTVYTPNALSFPCINWLLF